MGVDAFSSRRFMTAWGSTLSPQSTWVNLFLWFPSDFLISRGSNRGLVIKVYSTEADSQNVFVIGIGILWMFVIWYKWIGVICQHVYFILYVINTLNNCSVS